MNERGVQRVVPAMMLFEGARNQLEKDGLLRPIAKDNDHIWQQMPSEFFEHYLDSEELFMKAHREYDDYDEKKLPSYLDTCYALPDASNDKMKEELGNRLKQIEQRMYISCWYSSEDLSDMVFREYSKNGIALGTDVGQLIRCLNKFLCFQRQEDGEFAKDRFYVGNVQYVYHQQLVNEPIFENTQVICPMFLKGVQFKVDSEFRVCLFRKGNDGKKSIYVGKIPPRHLIRRVAFRADREHLAVQEKLEESHNIADDKSRCQIALPDSSDKTCRCSEKVRKLLKKSDSVDTHLMKTLESKLERVGLEIVKNSNGKKARVENGFIIYELREKRDD